MPDFIVLRAEFSQEQQNLLALQQDVMLHLTKYFQLEKQEQLNAQLVAIVQPHQQLQPLV